jgi:hypothetical protein
MARQCYALLHRGRIYTLQPTNPALNADRFKWRAFCDGQPWRFFRTKKDFERAVALEPGPPPLGPHAEAAFRAEAWSTSEGHRLLDALREAQEHRRREQRGAE